MSQGAGGQGRKTPRKSKKRKKDSKQNKTKEGLRELQNNMKQNNIHTIGMPEREEDHGTENMFEKVMKENFANLMREKVTQVQKAQRVPIKKNPKRPTPRHIIVKMSYFKDKERIVKAAREKQEVTYKGALVWLAADFSTETLQARRKWQEIFQVMKTKDL